MKTKSHSVPVALVVIFSLLILIGAGLVFFGIKNTIELNREIKNYEKTTGYLSDYKLDSEGGYDRRHNRKSAPTYFLTYDYSVNGTEYTVTTDYSTSFLPAIGSTREIRYNPADPQTAVAIGPNGNSTLIFVGALFAVVPSIFLVPILSSGKKRKRLLPVDGFRLVLGLILVLLGYGTLYLITGSFSFGGIFNYYRTSFTFPLVIPPILLAAGLFTAITAFFPKKLAEWNQKQQRYHEKLEEIKRQMNHNRH